jgi:hypothetical protein
MSICCSERARLRRRPTPRIVTIVIEAGKEVLPHEHRVGPMMAWSPIQPYSHSEAIKFASVKRALGRVFLVVHSSRFRPEFPPSQFIETSDKMIPQLPRSGLVSMAQLVDPDCHRVIAR